MSLWAEFNNSNVDQWKKKVLDDSPNKTIQDFLMKTEYGNVDTFQKSFEGLDSKKTHKLSEISWNFIDEFKKSERFLDGSRKFITPIPSVQFHE